MKHCLIIFFIIGKYFILFVVNSLKYVFANNINNFNIIEESSLDKISLRLLQKLSSLDYKLYLIKKFKINLNIIFKKYKNIDAVQKIYETNNNLYKNFLKNQLMSCILSIVKYNNEFYIFSYIYPRKYYKFNKSDKIHRYFKYNLEKQYEINLNDNQIYFIDDYIRNIIIDNKIIQSSLSPFILYL